MSLMKLQLDEANTVTGAGWANPEQRKAGDITEDGFTVYDLTDDEVDKLVVFHTKLIGGHLIVDADYVPPKVPEPQTDPDDEISAALAKQVANLTISNASLAKQVATLLAASTKKEAE